MPVSYESSTLEKPLSLCIAGHWTLRKAQTYRTPLDLGLPHYWVWVMHLWQKHHKSDARVFSPHLVRRHVQFISCDRLVQVMPAGLSVASYCFTLWN